MATIDDYVGKVWNMDALTLLHQLPDASVDLILTDPPYGNNNGQSDLAGARARDKVKGGRKRGNITPIDNDDTQSWKTLMLAVLPEFNRVLKPEGALCMFNMGGGGGGGVIYFAELALWIDQYLKFFNTVVWDKSKRGDGLGWRYRRNYEFVYIAHKQGGSLRWNKTRKARPNIVRYHPTKNELHPTQKPVPLLQEFILNHTYEGDIVLDPFCGSGGTGLAARGCNRQYILCDNSAVHYATASRQLNQDYTPPLFRAALEANG